MRYVNISESGYRLPVQEGREQGAGGDEALGNGHLQGLAADDLSEICSRISDSGGSSRRVERFGMCRFQVIVPRKNWVFLFGTIGIGLSESPA